MWHIFWNGSALDFTHKYHCWMWIRYTAQPQYIPRVLLSFYLFYNLSNNTLGIWNAGWNLQERYIYIRDTWILHYFVRNAILKLIFSIRMYLNGRNKWSNAWGSDRHLRVIKASVSVVFFGELAHSEDERLTLRFILFHSKFKWKFIIPVPLSAPTWL